MSKINKWYEDLKREFELSANFEEFITVYENEFDKVHYYKDVVNFITSLEGKCKLGILSNLGYIDKNRLDKQVNLSRFDYVWLSFELGYRKPQEEIYEIVEKECAFDTKDIIFIDDDKDNILMADKRGWNVLRACGYEFNKIKDKVYEFIN